MTGTDRRWRRAVPALLLVLALAAAAAPLPAQEPGVVRGVVRSEETSAPLAGALVEVSGAGVARVTAAGPDGGYELGGVPGGRLVVRANRLGYTPFEVEVMVPAGQEIRLDISLRAAPVVLDPVRVDVGRAGAAEDTVAAPDAELGLAGARVLQSSPGLAELGLADAAHGAPGQEPIDPSDVLYVRGTGTDLKLVYLDGAPVYAPFPLGGLLDPFTPDLLGSADVYLGGAPARYDGGLSYVLDLRTRSVRSDRVHSSGSMDLLAAGGVLETPIGSRAGLLFAGRSVHDYGTGRLAGNPLPYGYAEGLVRGDLRIGTTGMLSLTGFRNGEEVWLSGSGSPDSVIRWGNSALSLRYREELAGAGTELTASLGEFDARLPLLGTRPTTVHGRAERARLAADFTRRLDPVTVRYGASYDRQSQGYLRKTEGADTGPETTVGAGVAGAYADVGWQLSPDVRLRGGLRADLYTLESELVLGPRLAATWLVTDRASLTLAAGRYHQYLRPSESGVLAGEFGFAAGATPDTLVVGRSSHLSLALAQELGDGVRFGVEGFYKGFGGIPGGDAAAANASGVDVWMRRSEGRWTGWAGYSLAWVWSLPDGNRNTRFSGRHLLSTGLGLPLGDRGKLELGFSYGAGLPYAAIPITTGQAVPHALASNDYERLEATAGAPPLLPEPTRPYLRLDLSASRSWITRRAGVPLELTPYVRLLNTLGQRDALFYRYDRDSDDAPRALLVLPVVPVLGMEWKF